jgi:hypothetical protein
MIASPGKGSANVSSINPKNNTAYPYRFIKFVIKCIISDPPSFTFIISLAKWIKTIKNTIARKAIVLNY